MKTSSYVIGGVAVLVVLIGAGAWWWQQASAPPAAPVMAPQPVTEVPLAAAPVAAASAASEPAIAHPLELPAASAPAAAPRDIASVLTALFGRKAVLSMFQLQDFARYVVATVDNLGRAHASPRLWPVNPAPGRFLHQEREGATVVSADNGLRYTPHVLLLESIDPGQLVAAYVELYPQFQRAYEELGYPKRYFNDRLVEVIDLLLATPEVDGPVRVHLSTVNSPVKAERPWVLYEFDDPALQSLAAGQKILLRMGPINERRVKIRLKELRRRVATGQVTR